MLVKRQNVPRILHRMWGTFSFGQVVRTVVGGVADVCGRHRQALEGRDDGDSQEGGLLRDEAAERGQGDHGNSDAGQPASAGF